MYRFILNLLRTATGYKAKSPAADVYTLIISDLTDAAAKLPATASQQGRATQGAANALLGRVQMQNGDYACGKNSPAAGIMENIRL